MSMFEFLILIVSSATLLLLAYTSVHLKSENKRLRFTIWCMWRNLNSDDEKFKKDVGEMATKFIGQDVFQQFNDQFRQENFYGQNK